MIHDIPDHVQLLVQELVEHLCQTSDVLVILMIHDIPDHVQLLALQGPAPPDLFNLSLNDQQAGIEHVWIMTDIVSKHGTVVGHQNVILCPPVVHVSVCDIHHGQSFLNLLPELQFPGFLPCGGALNRCPQGNCKEQGKFD